MSTQPDSRTEEASTCEAAALTTLSRERVFALRPFILVALLVEYFFVLYVVEKQVQPEIVYSWAAAQASLLALWIVFGLRSTIARAQVLLVGVAVLAIANCYWPERWRSFPYKVEGPGAVVEMALLLLLQVASMCTPLLIVTGSGLVSLLRPDSSGAPPPSPRARRQFSLLQLMASMTCLTFVFAVASYYQPNDWIAALRHWFLLAPAVVALAVAALATFWLVLGSSRVIPRLGTFLVAAGFAWLPGLWLYLFAGYLWYPLSEWTEMIAGQTLLLVPVLLVLRLLGYRLRFHRPAPSAF